MFSLYKGYNCVLLFLQTVSVQVDLPAVREEGVQVEVVAEVSGRAAEDEDLVVLEDSREERPSEALTWLQTSIPPPTVTPSPRRPRAPPVRRPPTGSSSGVGGPSRKRRRGEVELLTLDDSTSSSCKSPRLGTLRDRGTLSSPARLQVGSPRPAPATPRPTRPKKGTPCPARKCVPMHRVTVHAVQDLNSRVRKLEGVRGNKAFDSVAMDSCLDRHMHELESECTY